MPESGNLLLTDRDVPGKSEHVADTRDIPCNAFEGEVSAEHERMPQFLSSKVGVF